ncbi:MAG: sugar isomerase domain-containing protein [Actinobacteria bacterium]|nr:MAG: sugar isomerase domain-containing protein [Actinomycetota bacterium]REK38256.1 MAG: sugar isomerase domain-containing protein [Actinomycetota bacterium]
MDSSRGPDRAKSAGVWIEQARLLLDHIESTQMGAIATAASWCANTIAQGGLVHLFGSGHSRIPLEEMFPRYGSFPGFHPMAELSMTFHTEVVGTNGQRQAMFIERVQGLAEVILSNYRFGEDDIMIVFSSSGRSAVPIEMAMGARRRKLRVIAVTSVSESMASEPTHPSGTRLLDNADLVIDIGTPPGDAMVAVDGLETPVGPGSTVANTAVVNEIKVQVAEILVERGIEPTVLTSSSLVGAERSEELFAEAYADYSHRLARVIDRGADR